MTAIAIYERGLLRPLSPLPLADGARVEVTVKDEAPLPRAEAVIDVSDLLHEIAALPMESENSHFSGRDHDRVLYGASDKVT